MTLVKRKNANTQRRDYHSDSSPGHHTQPLSSERDNEHDRHVTATYNISTPSSHRFVETPFELEVGGHRPEPKQLRFGKHGVKQVRFVTEPSIRVFMGTEDEESETSFNAQEGPGDIAQDDTVSQQAEGTVQEDGEQIQNAVPLASATNSEPTFAQPAEAELWMLSRDIENLPIDSTSAWGTQEDIQEEVGNLFPEISVHEERQRQHSKVDAIAQTYKAKDSRPKKKRKEPVRLNDRPPQSPAYPSPQTLVEKAEEDRIDKWNEEQLLLAVEASLRVKAEKEEQERKEQERKEQEREEQEREDSEDEINEQFLRLALEESVRAQAEKDEDERNHRISKQNDEQLSLRVEASVRTQNEENKKRKAAKKREKERLEAAMRAEHDRIEADDRGEARSLSSDLDDEDIVPTRTRPSRSNHSRRTRNTTTSDRDNERGIEEPHQRTYDPLRDPSVPKAYGGNLLQGPSEGALWTNAITGGPSRHGYDTPDQIERHQEILRNYYTNEHTHRMSQRELQANAARQRDSRRTNTGATALAPGRYGYHQYDIQRNSPAQRGSMYPNQEHSGHEARDHPRSRGAHEDSLNTHDATYPYPVSDRRSRSYRIGPPLISQVVNGRRVLIPDPNRPLRKGWFRRR
ncbi:hypothetical protein P280DRAFT_15824 [Massarina eburnea CBS 473.64]|uniref:Uncharacterized protein n=1 Tax=Massarina eburnea CBS 473.64 TaxID=1395130 RepID=A0A6A6SI26_9PLEO|nr:hypothetical protein P280DRAFT_15824 [Massarina eburnea CBS 473.64]